MKYSKFDIATQPSWVIKGKRIELDTMIRRRILRISVMMFRVSAHSSILLSWIKKLNHKSSSFSEGRKKISRIEICKTQNITLFYLVEKK